LPVNGNGMISLLSKINFRKELPENYLAVMSFQDTVLSFTGIMIQVLTNA
jgi:hypothetical protein